MNWSVFGVILVARLIAARYSIIADCDEVFNYWEPTHFVTHGFGLQTWEYSPVYAIRSWAYVFCHAIPIYVAKFLIQLFGKDISGSEFGPIYFGVLRCFLAVISSAVEAKLCSKLAKRVSSGIAKWYFIFTLFSTGMFQASVSYLPSSFAMCCVTYGLAEAAGMPSERCPNLVSSFVKSITAIAIGGILGWPFCAAVALPIGLRFVYVSFRSNCSREPNQPSCVFAPLWCITKGALAIIVRILPVTFIVVLVDSFMYNKEFTVVPFNIVAYNVLHADAESGPEIFGVEPWTYYFMNLALNFNIAFPLALVSYTALLSSLPHASRGHQAMLLTPFYLWFAIFTSTPHKEERFMYVVYPALCMNAAFALNLILPLIQVIVSKLGLRSLAKPLRSLTKMGAVVAFITISLSRSIALSQYYGAPVDLYSELNYVSTLANSSSSSNVCVGREWYRFPSSYFLTQSQRLKFVASGFAGLLPGEFTEITSAEQHIWESTAKVPPGMNNHNRADYNKIVSLEQCDFVVDTDMPVDREVGEVSLSELVKSDNGNWEVLNCRPFLNKDESSGLGQKFWLPHFMHSATKTRLVWSNYCVARKN